MAVAIDQGGCFETSKATTHGDPIYIIDDVVHYCVANMPGAVPKTSTMALTNATLPYAVEIADKGWKGAMKENGEIKWGANVVNGKATHKGVAEAFGLEYVPIDGLFGGFSIPFLHIPNVGCLSSRNLTRGQNGGIGSPPQGHPS